MELALTGRFMEAEEAQAVGLINRLTEQGGALAGALEIAQLIAQNAPRAVEVSRRVIASLTDTEEEWAFQAEVTSGLEDSADAREGALAFAAKRAPRWQWR
jgi:enoyl-CoA hydratase